MKSSRLPFAVQEILKDKLEHIKVTYAEVLDATEGLGEFVAKVKDQVCNLVSAESYTAKDAFTLAEGVDKLLDELIKYHRAICKVNYGLNEDNLMNQVTEQHGHMCQTHVSTNISDINMDKHNTSLNMLMVQMDTLQQQMSSQQDSYNSRLQELESKVLELKDDQVSSENKFDLRIQNVEARNLLIEDVQLREDTSIKNIENELSRMRTDVLSVQDDINRLDIHQDVIGEKLEELKRKADDLLRLRKILNDLHLNVTQREELTKKFNQLEEEMTTLNCVVNHLVTQIAENIPGEKVPMPVFVAQISEKHKVKPRDTISFSRVWQEYDYYDPATSRFKAPIGGLYLFSVSINADSEGPLTVAVVWNNNIAALCGTKSTDEQISTTVFLRLTAGDCVWIKAENLTNPKGVYVGRYFSNFIGCCLK